MFNFGLERDLVESNPCHKLKPPAREGSRDRVLSDDEIRLLPTALTASMTTAGLKGTRWRRRFFVTSLGIVQTRHSTRRGSSTREQVARE